MQSDNHTEFSSYFITAHRTREKAFPSLHRKKKKRVGFWPEGIPPMKARTTRVDTKVRVAAAMKPIRKTVRSAVGWPERSEWLSYWVVKELPGAKERGRAQGTAGRGEKESAMRTGSLRTMTTIAGIFTTFACGDIAEKKVLLRCDVTHVLPKCNQCSLFDRSRSIEIGPVASHPRTVMTREAPRDSCWQNTNPREVRCVWCVLISSARPSTDEIAVIIVVICFR